jgi:predicted outer membrane repeat protein
LTVTGSTFANNDAAVGGGIFNDGTLTVTNSTFVGNTALSGGGGGYFGGGIGNSNTLTVRNSTFSGNSSTNPGGGIYNQGTLNLVNTIIANSTNGGDCNNSGIIGTNTNTLVEDGSCSAALSGDPQLSSLAYNGGSTQTMALLAGSPAIDAGDDGSCPSTDQRGATRPQGLHCDIGAYESSFSAPPPAGHTISSFSLNGGGNAVTVPGGSSVTVDYTYQVWGDSSTCPGCNYQLVWGLDNNWQYCSAWTSPSPGDFPGLSGTGSQFTITAPATTGTYTIYSFSGQYADCTAAESAYTSAGGTVQGTITIP